MMRFAALRQRLTTSRPFMRTLRAIFGTQAAIVRRAIRRNEAIDLSQWTNVLAEAADAHNAPIANTSFRKMLTQYLRETRRPRGMGFVNVGSSVPYSMDVPEVREFIRRMSIDFAIATNKASVAHANRARDQFREALAQHLDTGRANVKLAEDLDRIFHNPQRASLIAHNEQSRAVHGGQFLAAHRFSEPVNKEWVASDDACEICLGYRSQGAIPLDRPFSTTASKNPAYAVVQFAPAHPNCFCSIAYSVI
jgi:hypothetical protein